MRIAYILTSLGTGGAERQVTLLARRMARRGHAVKLLVLLPRGAENLRVESNSEPLEVTYLGIRKNPMSFLRGLMYAAAETRRFHPDVLHGNNFHGNLMARFLGIAYRKTRVVSTIHNVYEGAWPRMLAYRLTDGMSAHTIAVSEAARERYVRLRAVPAQKCGVIANGVDAVEFAPNAPRRMYMRTLMSAGEKFVWLAVGRLAPAKDYPNLLRAFAKVREANGEAELWIAGDGAEKYARELRLQADVLRLSESIQWLGLRRDVAALLDAADGFVLASAWEGMPLALGEAMAMAKPVVATSVGGVHELLGEGGKLVEAGNSAALADAMVADMRMNEEERTQMGEAARVRVAEQFSIDAKAEEWERVYRAIRR
jgi:glycosyltransferase involved in cell wall biosynthesis